MDSRHHNGFKITYCQLAYIYSPYTDHYLYHGICITYRIIPTVRPRHERSALINRTNLFVPHVVDSDFMPPYDRRLGCWRVLANKTSASKEREKIPEQRRVSTQKRTTGRVTQLTLRKFSYSAYLPQSPSTFSFCGKIAKTVA